MIILLTDLIKRLCITPHLNPAFHQDITQLFSLPADQRRLKYVKNLYAKESPEEKAFSKVLDAMPESRTIPI